MSLFPGAPSPPWVLKLPFVFVVLAFPFPSLYTGELCQGPAGASALWICTLRLKCSTSPGWEPASAALNEAITTPSRTGDCTRFLGSSFSSCSHWVHGARQPRFLQLVIGSSALRGWGRRGIGGIFLGLLGLKLFCSPYSYVFIWIRAEIPERAYFCHLY